VEPRDTLVGSAFFVHGAVLYGGLFVRRDSLYEMRFCTKGLFVRRPFVYEVIFCTECFFVRGAFCTECALPEVMTNYSCV
jgi:hypothetical protein